MLYMYICIYIYIYTYEGPALACLRGGPRAHGLHQDAAGACHVIYHIG